MSGTILTLGAGIFLLINKENVLESINEIIFYSVLWFLLVYGIVGFVNNLFKLNQEEKKIWIIMKYL